MDSIIRTQGVNRIFHQGAEEIHALRDISIEVPRGSLTVLRGRSGSGKTTLMNLLGGLDKPDGGTIEYNGTRVDTATDNQRDDLRRTQMGFIFQSVALIGLLSAYENVDFALRVAEFPAAERDARARECLGFVGLQKRMDHRPLELSGGEQQRVAIARAIAHRPQLLFADEPTAELDSHMGLQVIRVFRDLVRDHGITIVMTTHDPNMVELADYVITLEDGGVIEQRAIVRQEGDE